MSPLGSPPWLMALVALVAEWVTEWATEVRDTVQEWDFLVEAQPLAQSHKANT
jgi:hypothetical protein